MIFKIHYGLWNGALVGIIPFMFNYAIEYSGASGTQHGTLYTVLPFVALIVKPMVCSLADRYASHRHCLLFFIFTTLLGYGSLAIYPFFPDLTKNHKSVVWALFCLAALIGNTSMCVVNSISDTLAIRSCQRNEVSYGHYRLWGPVGFGIFGAIWGVANEIPSLPKYTPGILTMVVILIINSLVIALWYDKSEFVVLSRKGSLQMPELTSSETPETKFRNGTQHDVAPVIKIGQAGDDNSHRSHGPRSGQLGLLWELCRQQTSIFAYLFLFVFCGVMTAIHWQFFFRYLERISNRSFSVIATLAIPVQALGGELAFFMFSNVILKKLGASLVLVLCLFSFAARYLLYAFVIPYVNMYWILLVELLQGPAFGLMYCVLTHQSNYYSERVDDILEKNSAPGDVKLKNSLHATLQGILGAAFEGLGLGLGAIIGGRAYDVAPLLMWQIAGFSALFVAFVCLLILLVASALRDSDQTERAISIEPTNLDGETTDQAESHVIEKLRDIAKSCQSPGEKPSMSEVRVSLEELSKKLKP